MPVVVWDDEDSSSRTGFRVTENLDKFIPPADYKVDPDDPSHFIPVYNSCKYRRRSIGITEGRPWCHIHCLVLEEIVDHTTCMDCELRVDAQGTPVHQITGLPEAAPEKDHAKVLATQHQKEIDDATHLEDDTRITVFDLIQQPDTDPVFDPTQPKAKYSRPDEGGLDVRNPTPWEPCKYREKADAECSSCNKQRCGCEACPLFDYTVTKKDCRKCEYRKEN